MTQTDYYFLRSELARMQRRARELYARVTGEPVHHPTVETPTPGAIEAYLMAALEHGLQHDTKRTSGRDADVQPSECNQAAHSAQHER